MSAKLEILFRVNIDILTRNDEQNIPSSTIHNQILMKFTYSVTVNNDVSSSKC